MKELLLTIVVAYVILKLLSGVFHTMVLGFTIGLAIYFCYKLLK